ncbi:MAG: phage tail protein, partial [Rhodanobacter sp.]
MSAIIPGTQGWLTNIGLSVLAGGLAQALVKKPRTQRPQHDVQYAGTVEPRRILYGQLKLSGMHVIPAWTSGDGNKFLHQVIALAGHRFEAIGNVYFNQDEIEDSNISAVGNSASSGLVTAGTYDGRANVRRYIGTIGQSSDYILRTAFPTQWTTSHTGGNVPYIACQFELDDKDNEVYKGSPPIVSAICQGKRCYDPRLDDTPGADPTNADYIEYTTNPALCLADYLTQDRIGCGIPTAKIDWDLVVTAANICDEDVVIPPSASPANTQARYTCNVVMFVATNEQQRRDNIEVLVSAMMGHVYFRGGKYRMYAGCAQESSFELTESDLVGSIEITTEVSADKKYNYVRGQFVDAARNYQLLEFEPQSNSTYEDDDNGRLVREADLSACTNQYEAQRNARIILERSRLKLEIKGTFGMSAFKLRPGDVGTITLSEWGLDEFLVRCMSWKFLPDFTIEVVLMEEDASDWDDPAIADYIAPTVGSGPTAGPFTPGIPQSFTAKRIQDGILFQWDWPTIVAFPAGFNLYEADTASPLPTFEDATLIKAGIYADNFTLLKADTTTRRYWLTSFHGASNNESLPIPTSGTGIAGRALAVTTGFRATVNNGSHVKTLVGTGSGTTVKTSTVTAIEGTAPYTYA